jgi:hypothetical protein
LNVAVLPRGAREDGIVDDDAVDGLVGICINDFLFDILLVNGAEAKIETTGEELAAKSYTISNVAADDLCMLADHIPPEPFAESLDELDFATRLLGNQVMFILDVNFGFLEHQFRNRACALIASNSIVQAIFPKLPIPRREDKQLTSHSMSLHSNLRRLGQRGRHLREIPRALAFPRA